jgi:5'-nucleotidase
MTCPLILVTNDDGIRAPLLTTLADGLDTVGEVWVYAPESQQSAVGHGVSLHRPLRVTRVKERWFMVDGTPTDCVMLAVRSLLPSRPKLVVSGINPGPNLGDDVTYSGTVAGAYEGMLLGIPSFAISLVSMEPKHPQSAARFAVTLAKYILARGLPADTVLNVNVPDGPYDAIAGVSFTRMGRRNYQDEIISRVDPRGRTYYWIGGADPSHFSEPGTDFEAIDNNRISVTPLQRDITNHAALDLVKSWLLSEGAEPRT